MDVCFMDCLSAPSFPDVEPRPSGHAPAPPILQINELESQVRQFKETSEESDRKYDEVP